METSPLHDDCTAFVASVYGFRGGSRRNRVLRMVLRCSIKQLHSSFSETSSSNELIRHGQQRTPLAAEHFFKQTQTFTFLPRRLVSASSLGLLSPCLLPSSADDLPRRPKPYQFTVRNPNRPFAAIDIPPTIVLRHTAQ